MKQKVALVATSLNLILCVVFLVICANSAQGAMDAATLGELTRINRFFAPEVEKAAEAGNPSDLLFQFAQDTASGFALYASDGRTLVTGTGGAEAFKPGELAAEPGKISAFRHKGNYERWTLYASSVLADGSVFLTSRPAATLGQAMAGRPWLLVLLALVVAVFSFVAFQTSIDRTDAFIRRVLNVLTSFSEGRFDARVASVTADSVEQTAHFNEVLARIQDSVYKNKARNQALSTVMNYMQNGILAVDEKLQLILVTPSAKKLLGITGSIDDPVPINQASRDVKLDAAFKEAMAQDGVYTTEVAVRTGMGRAHMPVRLYMTPMTKDGQVVGAVALVEDITELRRLEQVRTDFAANVSHELKTPLTSIKGFVETLQNGAIANPETAQKFLKIIMLEADRLTRLINDILSISKLESGNDSPPKEFIRLDTMAHEISEMLSILASEKDVTISSRENNEPSFVYGNADQMEQMLINLIENGIKYNKRGGNVNVSVFNSEKTVNLLISDTGIGIPEEHLPRLFERFYRVDKGRSRSMGGTGLGLAIVKHIASNMGAMIEVHSKFGEGTEFLITFPSAHPPKDDRQHNYDDLADGPDFSDPNSEASDRQA
jgi:two-component system phosphate regulon sensor histidine kinase PhoR